MTTNYPNNYPTSIDCLWYIAAPKGKRLILHFNDFSTEPCCDKLNIFDGKTPAGTPAIEKYNIRKVVSGNVKPNDVLSAGNDLSLDFYSDQSGLAGGFLITYDIVS